MSLKQMQALYANKEALAQPEYQSTADKSKLEKVPAKGTLLAQPEQEPVAFENWHKANYIQNLEKYGDTYKNNHVRCRYQGWLGAQSFLPQRTWVGLTDSEIDQMGLSNYIKVVRQTEAKLKEKNT